MDRPAFDRRELLRLMRSGLVVSALASSSSFAQPFGAQPFAAKPKAGTKVRPDTRLVALLVPLSGPHAALGTSMANAASLVESSSQLMRAFDTGGTPAGAAAAARAALKARAGLILGPLTSAEVPAVTAAVAGKVPVVAFTNDAAQAATGAFVFGITPAQATSAVLR